MRLFGKSDSKNKKKEIDVEQQAVSQNTNVFESTEALTPEEVAKSWFLRRYGEPLPQELQTWFDRLAEMKTEGDKDKLQILDQEDVKKIKEGILFCKTQLNNIDETINSIWQQESRNREIEHLTSRLEEYRKNYYNINKLYTSILIQARELERYEAFEPIQGHFQRILVLNEELRRKNKLQVQASRALEESKKQFRMHHELLKSCQQQRIEAEMQAEKAQSFLNESYHIQGVLNKLDRESKNLTEKEHRLNLSISEVTKKSKEQKQEFDRLKNKQEEIVIEKRKYEAFQKLFEKNDTILVLLDFLFEISTQKEQLKKVLKDIRKRQTEQNDLLNKLFSQHQEIENQLSGLQNELKVSLQNNIGEDSFHLQERAADLTRKYQMLLGAKTLWKKISEGYLVVDEKTLEISRIQMRVDSMYISQNKLEIEVKNLCERFEQMQYSYTLSKSTDLLQLRKDLREGYSCSVCGAAHHPYHSETELAQGVLISQIQADYEAGRSELQRKQIALQQMKIQLAKEQGILGNEQNALEYIKKIHNINIAEWSAFAFLDRSFSDCTSSTNRDARMVMIQQLIEKIEQDRIKAQEELNTFNFHQNNINKINKKIAKLERNKNELVIRLNEVNTECQVLAYQVEKQETDYRKINEDYSELYGKLDRCISYPEWFKKWLENPESLKIKIQEQTSCWNKINKQIIANELLLARKQADVEMFRSSIEMQSALLDEVKMRMEQIREIKNNLQTKLYKMFGEESPQDFFTKKYQQVVLLRKKEDLQRETTNNAAIEEKKWNEHYTYLLAMQGELEAMCKEERTQLDLWIRKYNAGHSPVQYSELEKLFTSQTDWNALRKNIRRIEVENNMAQKAMDDLNTYLASLQINISQCGATKTGHGGSSEFNKKELEKKRFGILKQLAVYENKLLLHQQGLAREQLRKEELKNTLL